MSYHRRFPTEPRPQGFHILKVISGIEAFLKVFPSTRCCEGEACVLKMEQADVLLNPLMTLL